MKVMISVVPFFILFRTAFCLKLAPEYDMTREQDDVSVYKKFETMSFDGEKWMLKSPAVLSDPKKNRDSLKNAQEEEALRDDQFPFLYRPHGHGPGYCGPYPGKFYSQFQEDRDLYCSHFRNTTNGTFVEIGAIDGNHWSNTRFYDHFMGWSGVLIEASPESAEQLVKNRGNNSRNSIFQEGVCVESQKTIQFAIDGAPQTHGMLSDMSSGFQKLFHPEKTLKVVEVPCRPISVMIQQHLKHSGADHIDLFSLDVEGGEFEVLKTFDFRVPVKLWLIEMDPAMPEKNKKVRALLTENNYKRQNPRFFRSTREQGSPVNNEVWVPKVQ